MFVDRFLVCALGLRFITFSASQDIETKCNRFLWFAESREECRATIIGEE